MLAVLMSACTVGPAFQRPDTPGPAGWASEGAGFETGAPIDLEWWEAFGDPQLSSLVERAAGHNHDVRVARAGLLEARAVRQAAVGALLPALGAAGSYRRSELSERAPLTGGLVESGLADREIDTWDGSFDARWEIDVFGGRRRGVEQGDALARGAADGLGTVLLSVAAEVARAYIELRGLQRQTEVVERNLALQEQTLVLTENRRRVGLSPEIDVARARTQVESTRALLPGLHGAARSTIYRLSVLVGEPPATLVQELAPHAPIPAGRTLVPIGLPTDLVERRPDVRRAEQNLAAAVAGVGVAEAELYPKFFVTGLAGFQSVSADDFFSAGARTWSVGPMIRWRLFEGGRLRAEIHAAEAREQQALARFEQAVLLALEDVERAMTTLEAEKQEYDSWHEAAREARRSASLARILYEEGLRDFLTVLDAERRLAEVDRELTRSEAELGTRLVALYKALGGGWEQLEHEQDGDAAAARPLAAQYTAILSDLHHLRAPARAA
jgi:NodT family efflux transporter outer membrane factor (OMF) lipoprotein